MHLLVVVEDEHQAASLSHLFGSAGFEVTAVTTARHAIAHVESIETVLVILDLALSDTHGVELCRSLRVVGFGGGIVIVSGLADELDVVAGLDAGADDYLGKLCSIAELQSRVRSVVRRIQRHDDAAVQGLPATLQLEVVDHHVVLGGEEIATHGREFDVLALLISERGRVVSRETLINQVWGADWTGSPMVLSSAVARIRSRLDAVGAAERVENVRGVGFRLSKSA